MCGIRNMKNMNEKKHKRNVDTNLPMGDVKVKLRY